MGKTKEHRENITLGEYNRGNMRTYGDLKYTGRT